MTVATCVRGRPGKWRWWPISSVVESDDNDWPSYGRAWEEKRVPTGQDGQQNGYQRARDVHSRDILWTWFVGSIAGNKTGHWWRPRRSCDRWTNAEGRHVSRRTLCNAPSRYQCPPTWKPVDGSHRNIRVEFRRERISPHERQRIPICTRQEFMMVTSVFPDVRAFGPWRNSVKE